MNAKRIGRAALLMVAGAAAAPAAQAQCPYSSVQIRVQINTTTHWNTSSPAALNKNVHIGVFKNGWGVPIDQGGVTVYALQGSYNQVLGLAGWETWWKPSVSRPNDRWIFEVWCGGSFRDRAEVTWGNNLDVLPYVLPNYPGQLTGTPHTVITDKTNNWRTYSNAGGNVGERLPGFYITKGGIDWTWTGQPGYQTIHWNFEQMIYDSQWIYLVRDTSWTALCSNNHVAGQLLFTQENGQWLRGGRHFPRSVVNGGTRDTGNKYVQGVQRAQHHNDRAGEGSWCTTPFSGWTSSTVYGEWIGRQTLGNRTFDDVLRLYIPVGSGASDEWWFARGVGMILFNDGTQIERHASTANDFPITVRIPCYPGVPCH